MTKKALVPIVLPANPTAALEAAPKQYVDAHPSTVTTWTPTVAGLTKGNGTQSAWYIRQGRICHISYRFAFGSTSAITAQVKMPPPFPLLDWASCGNGLIYDASTISSYPVLVGPEADLNTLGVFLFGYGTTLSVMSAVLTTGIPMAWTVSDEFWFSMTYITAT